MRTALCKGACRIGKGRRCRPPIRPPQDRTDTAGQVRRPGRRTGSHCYRAGNAGRPRVARPGPVTARTVRVSGRLCGQWGPPARRVIRVPNSAMPCLSAWACRSTLPPTSGCGPGKILVSRTIRGGSSGAGDLAGSWRVVSRRLFRPLRSGVSVSEPGGLLRARWLRNEM